MKLERAQHVLAILACAFAIDCGSHQARGSESSASIVVHIQIQDQPITPAIVQYVRRSLRVAYERDAQCLVIELDTPGGVLKSTQEIVKEILTSEIPVVVYVSPTGARAASAGLFITLAGHVAAVAPGTRIGAAHPVQIGGLPLPRPTPPSPRQGESDGADSPSAKGEGLLSSTMEEKVLNDTVAWAKALAELSGRNAEWAALAVSESRVLVASEAVEENVVDLLAADLRTLLRDIDGRLITLQQERGRSEPVRLRTVGATVHSVDMWWGERLLAVISNPNIALVLLIFGFYGILFEFYSPGWGVAGTLGAVSLVLGFFGLSVLPINYAGLVLIFLALGMFVAEAFVTSFGMLAAGGIFCLIVGGTMLIDSPAGFMQVSMSVLAPISVATSLITLFLVTVKVALVEVKHVDLPEHMKRAMAKQAESERERRAKVIHDEGESQAAAKLREAAEMIEAHPMAMQMRFLQTLVEVGAENNTTIVFPVPLELAQTFTQLASVSNGKPREGEPVASVC